jgi:hypothetical protein
VYKEEVKQVHILMEQVSQQLKAHKLRIAAQSDAIQQLNREQAALIGMCMCMWGERGSVWVCGCVIV